MRKVLVVGGGVWGVRVAGKLRDLGHSVIVADASHTRVHEIHKAWQGNEGFTAIADYAAFLTMHRVDAAVVCVPPCKQLEVASTLAASGVRRIRVEKPCGTSVDEARQIAALDADTSVGYQMLDHPAWRIACSWITTRGGVVDAWRFSRSPRRHDVSALLDLGSHAAAYLADADATGMIYAGFELDDTRILRATSGDGVLVMRESPTGMIVEVDGITLFDDHAGPYDVLGTSLTDWLNDRGRDASFASSVHRILETGGIEV